MRAPSAAAGRVASLAMMTALAFVLSYVERSVLPPFDLGAPGIKLGLANVVVLIALYEGGFVRACAVSLIRVMVTGFVFNLSAVPFSIAGGLLSLCLMGASRRSRWFSTVGVSMVGGVFHNVGQILLAMLLLRSTLLVSYLPALLIAGAATGLATGLVAAGVLRRLRARSS